MTWDDYSHECQPCFDRYNAQPRQEPCYQHRGQKQVHRELDDRISGSGYVWHEGDEPFDFQSGSIMHKRLSFLRFIWGAKPQEAH